MRKCVHIRTLNLSFCGNVSDVALAAIASHARNIEDLNITMCEMVTGAGMLIPAFASVLLTHSMHVHIRQSFTQLQPSNFVAFQAFPKC